MTDRYLTTAEAAEALQVSQRCIVAWCESGKIKAIQPGGKKGAWRIHPSVVEGDGMNEEN